ncbi:MAG: hypothetical protein GY844_04270 [Bradyrhizobium sp.]|nr:hypothetical protein [Bradyrhizobium sp.]
MTNADIASCREAAEECRRLAVEVADPLEKQELLYIADGWLTLPLAPEIVAALEQLTMLG